MQRRASAIVLVLAMLMSLPVAGMRRCLECPANCPMHTAAPQAHKPHCHETGAAPAAASNGLCMRRAACGHTAPELLSAVPAVLPPAVPLVQHSVVTVLSPVEQYLVGEADPEPATGPPRASAIWV